MKRRNAVRIISFLVAVLVATATLVFIKEGKNRRYLLEIERGYSRSLDDFAAGMNNISLTLQKARYVTTPAQLSSMAARLLSEAEISKNALAQLPAGENLTVINRFLSQVGNYAMSVSKNLITDGTVSQSDRDNIVTLSDTAEKMAQIVSDTSITYNNADYWAEELDRELDDAVDVETLASSLGEIEDEFSDYPTLVYDGPYSDHILEKEPLMLKDRKEISKEKAQNIAEKTAEADNKKFEYDGTVSGNIPSYRFSAEDVSVTVSQKGGYPVYMRKERAIGQEILSYDQAQEKAKRYLERIGMKGFIQTYYANSDGVCVVNFAYLDGETICYTDLLKVGVAMDNGEIMFFEASGYISNHTDRAFETPEYTDDVARSVLSDSLKLKKTALALIPTNGGGEVRCYEFTCETEDNREILIYINTQTLAEEDILILLKSDGGILVK